MAVQLTMKMGNCLAQATLPAFHRASTAISFQKNRGNVIKFTYVAGLKIYC